MKLVKAAGRPAAVALASFFVACTCTDVPATAGSPKYAVGGPYRIKARWYHPRMQPGYDRVGVASWYGGAFHGRRTANGERFDMNALTAAHPTLPLSSLVHVTNLDNGRRIALRINDRGPFARNRILDISHAGARALGFDAKGTARVRVTVIDGSTMTAEGKGTNADGTGEGEASKTGTTSSHRVQLGSQGRDFGSRDRGRARPTARTSYLRQGPMRRRRAAPRRRRPS